jgi:hypothetical protein
MCSKTAGMNSKPNPQWFAIHATMQRQRPRIEWRAQSSPGRYWGNLAREWRLFLVREFLS